MEGGSATTRATNSVWSAMTCLALLCLQTLKSMVAAPDFKPVDLATAAKCTFQRTAYESTLTLALLLQMHRR